VGADSGVDFPSRPFWGHGIPGADSDAVAAAWVDRLRGASPGSGGAAGSALTASPTATCGVTRLAALSQEARALVTKLTDTCLSGDVDDTDDGVGADDTLAEFWPQRLGHDAMVRLLAAAVECLPALRHLWLPHFMLPRMVAVGAPLARITRLHVTSGSSGVPPDVAWPPLVAALPALEWLILDDLDEAELQLWLASVSWHDAPTLTCLHVWFTRRPVRHSLATALVSTLQRQARLLLLDIHLRAVVSAADASAMDAAISALPVLQELQTCTPVSDPTRAGGVHVHVLGAQHPTLERLLVRCDASPSTWAAASLRLAGCLPHMARSCQRLCVELHAHSATRGEGASVLAERKLVAALVSLHGHPSLAMLAVRWPRWTGTAGAPLDAALVSAVLGESAAVWPQLQQLHVPGAAAGALLAGCVRFPALQRITTMGPVNADVAAALMCLPGLRDLDLGESLVRLLPRHIPALQRAPKTSVVVALHGGSPPLADGPHSTTTTAAAALAAAEEGDANTTMAVLAAAVPCWPDLRSLALVGGHAGADAVAALLAALRACGGLEVLRVSPVTRAVTGSLPDVAGAVAAWPRLRILQLTLPLPLEQAAAVVHALPLCSPAASGEASLLVVGAGDDTVVDGLVALGSAVAHRPYWRVEVAHACAPRDDAVLGRQPTALRHLSELQGMALRGDPAPAAAAAWQARSPDALRRWQVMQWCDCGLVHPAGKREWDEGECGGGGGAVCVKRVGCRVALEDVVTGSNAASRAGGREHSPHAAEVAWRQQWAAAYEGWSRGWAWLRRRAAVVAVWT
jgi:hypothetical protein